MNTAVRRIILIIVWFLLTIFYVWNEAEVGRSMGAQANSSIDFVTKTYINKYNDYVIDTLEDIYNQKPDKTTLEESFENVEETLDDAFDSYFFSQFYDLTKDYKTNVRDSGIITVIYMVLTLLCYHFAFVYTGKEKKNNIQPVQPEQGNTQE